MQKGRIRMSLRKAVLMIVALALLVPGMALAGRGITIKGSDTMVILAQRWAEKYMSANEGSVIQVTGGGSGVGIAALINGTTDIATASRTMKQDEKLKLRDRYQTMGVEIPVAKDGLSVYVHESSSIKDLSFEQLRDIYTGKITNWKQIGGPDARITLYGRENSSGTYVFFKDTVLLGADFAAQCQTLPGTAAVVNAVAQDPNGIGYGGAAYAKGVRECGVRKDATTPAVMPSAATVKDGSYPLSRPLFFYTRKSPAGDAKKFIDWVLSDEGQAIVTQVGYFPVK
jgi:phosphate transport system substrate-binding protein